MLKLDPDKELIILLDPSTIPAIRAWKPANTKYIHKYFTHKYNYCPYKRTKKQQRFNIRTPASKTSCHSTPNQVPEKSHILCIYLLIQICVFYFLSFYIISFLFCRLSNFVSDWNILYLFLWYSILAFLICRRKFFF